MPDVAVHDAEEEREGDGGEEGRVGLLVAPHAVRVDHALEDPGELVGLEVGRRGLALGRLDGDDGQRHLLVVGLPQRHDRLVRALGEHPALGDEEDALVGELVLVVLAGGPRGVRARGGW